MTLPNEQNLSAAVQEWLASGVDPGIVTLNVEEVSERGAVELILSNRIARLQKVTSYITAESARLLQRYSHLESGGWWVSGVDPLNNWDRMDWGQLKPTQPRADPDKSGKLIKYESPVGEPTRAIFLDVPPDIAERVYTQAGINPTADDRTVCFWHCVKKYGIPTVLVEGAKKAGAVLTAGYAAIALPGIWNGRRVERDGFGKTQSETLIPDLAVFADGRPIIFGFDQDEKPKTRRAVASAIRATSRLFEAQGCSCQVARWQSDWGKGIDDVAVARGHETVRSLLTTASPYNNQQALASLYQASGFTVQLGGNTEAGELSEVEKRDRNIRKREARFRSYWEALGRDFKLTSTQNHPIAYYRGYAPTLELQAKTILLRGWLGAGKSEASMRTLLPCRDRQIIWLANRNGLLRQTAQRLVDLGFSNIYHYQDDPGLYREMLRDDYPGIYLMCPDSLKDYATKHANWTKTILVIDEFSGIRKEVLSKTAIVPEFERLLTEAQILIAVDAFLGNVDARVIAGYRGTDRTSYDQEFAKSPKPIKWLETRTRDGKVSMSHDGLFYLLLQQWVEAGYSFAITADNKLQAKAVHDYLVGLGVKVALSTRETVETNKELLRIPDGYLFEHQIHTLVYTPVAQSGLDVQTHFDKGLALYSGVVSPLDFLQMMGRCRQCDEWFVSAPRRSLDPTCATPSLNSSRVKNWAEKLTKAFDTLGFTYSSQTTGWGLWQRLTSEVEKAFHSEYLYCLLVEFFESVETVEVAVDQGTWQSEVKRIKREEASLTLKANLDNGRRRLREQKAPSKNSEVWDLVLAQEAEKYPAVWRELRDRYHTAGEDETEVIDLALVFLSQRLERLKHWVVATDEQAQAELAELGDSLRQRFTSYSSPQFKVLQYRTLFQEFNLDELAQARRSQAVAHETHYRIDSPVITKHWEQFQRSSKLQKLFPTVENQFDFWTIIKRCMTFFGYEHNGTTIRVNTPGQLNRNGKDRHGKARLSPSASLYFSGWLPMPISGSLMFQKLFDVIVKAIRARLDCERSRRSEVRERASPLNV